MYNYVESYFCPKCSGTNIDIAVEVPEEDFEPVKVSMDDLGKERNVSNYKHSFKHIARCRDCKYTVEYNN